MARVAAEPWERRRDDEAMNETQKGVMLMRDDPLASHVMKRRRTQNIRRGDVGMRYGLRWTVGDEIHYSIPAVRGALATQSIRNSAWISMGWSRERYGRAFMIFF